MNTTTRIHENITAQQAICLNLTTDDPVAGAKALIALRQKTAPTLVVAGFGVQAYWIFDPPKVSSTQLEQFAEALTHAALDCGLQGSARVSEIVPGNTVSAAEMKAGLSEFLPSNYARAKG